MGEETKNQHYNPQFYQRNFSSKVKRKIVGDDEFYIEVYDKSENKRYETNIRNNGSENYFYNIPNYFSEPKIVDKTITKLEGLLLPTFFNVIDKCTPYNVLSLENKLFTNEEKIHLAELMAFQFLRSINFREEFIVPLLKRDSDKVFLNFLEENEIKTSEVISLLQGHFMFKKETEHLGKLMNELLENKLWIIGVNPTDKPFIISDSPVVRFNHIGFDLKEYNKHGEGYLGYSFPLTPKFNIICFGGFGKAETPYKDNFVILDNDRVEFFNTLQKEQSVRRIYSNSKSYLDTLKK